MSNATFTFRVDEAPKSEFSTAAKNCGRNAAQLLRDFMRDFVRQQQEAAEHDIWFHRQVQIGLDSANAGNLIPAAEVEAKFAAKLVATRRRLEASEWSYFPSWSLQSAANVDLAWVWTRFGETPIG